MSQEDHHPSFFLWHPAIDRDGFRCSLDVTAYEAQQLERGTFAVMSNFLDAVNIPSTPKSWRIESFCSPYFSNNLEAPDWMDRIVRAWRVEIEMETAVPADTLPVLFRPFSATATDDTWVYDLDGWKWSTQRAIVIGHYPIGIPGPSLAEIAADVEFASCERIVEVMLGNRACQRRFDLGVRHFPEDEALVMEVLRAARLRFGAINWQTSIPFGMRAPVG